MLIWAASVGNGSDLYGNAACAEEAAMHRKSFDEIGERRRCLV